MIEFIKSSKKFVINKYQHFIQDVKEFDFKDGFYKIIGIRLIQNFNIFQVNNFNDNYSNYNKNIQNPNQFNSNNLNNYEKGYYTNINQLANNFENNNFNKNNYINKNFEINNYLNSIAPENRHLRGLVNIASTCYMNSILQCFCHIKELSVYFQSEKMNQLVSCYKNDNNKMFPVFQEVIKQLWKPYDNSSYSPYNFKNRLGNMNPLFRGSYPNDAKDLLTFLLLQLHEELNKPKINGNSNNNSFNINMQNDRKLMFKNFTKFFSKNYRSIISELFYGAFYTETKCNFGHIFYNYQTFNFIIFPLEKVLQFKINSNNNFMSYNNNTVTLEDCFKYYQYPTNLNDYYCNQCRMQGNCTYTNKFSIFPNIIIIILNRGQGLQYNINISFENENLGLKDYAEYCNDESIYELIGMVTHYGESNASGHFVARCKSPFDGEWYLYNDQIVQKIGYFDNKSFAQGNPYILFYKKINFME